jgi:hypothetical protein
MAMVFNTSSDADGVIVTCRYAVPPAAFNTSPEYGIVWVIDRPITWRNSQMKADLPVCPDQYLRPIRDPGDDAVDEMVQLLGRPSEVTA